MSELKESSSKTASVSLEPRTFKVSGMTCNACVNTVERALNSMPGVSATVNFAAETAHVLAPAEVSGKEIIKKIESAGYESEEVGDNEAITLHSKKSAVALVFALIFTIPVIVFSMVMSWHKELGKWLATWVPGFFENYNWSVPTNHQMINSALLILSSPVVLFVEIGRAHV